MNNYFCLNEKLNFKINLEFSKEETEIRPKVQPQTRSIFQFNFSTWIYVWGTKAAPWDEVICDQQGQLGWPLQLHVPAASSKEEGHGRRKKQGKNMFSGYLLAVVILVGKEGGGKDKKREKTLPTI